MANDSSMSYALPLNTSGEEWIDWLGSAFISRGIFNHSGVPQVLCHCGARPFEVCFSPCDSNLRL